jgi:hypothetical protein
MTFTGSLSVCAVLEDHWRWECRTVTERMRYVLPRVSEDFTPENEWPAEEDLELISSKWHEFLREHGEPTTSLLALPTKSAETSPFVHVNPSFNTAGVSRGTPQAAGTCFSVLHQALT